MLNKYQKVVENSSKEKYEHFSLLLLGLGEECGEVLQLFKKAGRDKTNINAENLLEELSDVLWYLTAIGVRYGINLKDIVNFSKIKSLARDKNIRSKVIGYTHDELTGEEMPIFEEDLDENSEYKKSLQ